ncbi:hypothetical protein BC940DRAFT_319500 [Gongronella butleri]|nr:hypothetical protein BC940DRAFT_319500 [Gongronella butleri]
MEGEPMAGLSGFFPNELVLEIVNAMDWRSVLEARSCNRSWRYFLDPIVFRHIKIHTLCPASAVLPRDQGWHLQHFTFDALFLQKSSEYHTHLMQCVQSVTFQSCLPTRSFLQRIVQRCSKLVALHINLSECGLSSSRDRRCHSRKVRGLKSHLDLGGIMQLTLLGQKSIVYEFLTGMAPFLGSLCSLDLFHVNWATMDVLQLSCPRLKSLTYMMGAGHHIPIGHTERLHCSGRHPGCRLCMNPWASVTALKVVILPTTTPQKLLYFIAFVCIKFPNLENLTIAAEQAMQIGSFQASDLRVDRAQRLVDLTYPYLTKLQSVKVAPIYVTVIKTLLRLHRVACAENVQPLTL